MVQTEHIEEGPDLVVILLISREDPPDSDRLNSHAGCNDGFLQSPNPSEPRMMHKLAEASPENWEKFTLMPLGD